MENTLTVKEGLEIQKRQLTEWKKVLKPKAYSELCKIIKAKNERANYKTGYDVFRGTDIDSGIQNWFILGNDYNKK